MKLYIHIGEIQGRGQIPFDMLRYDRAFPYRESDSAAIERRDLALHDRVDDSDPVQVATLRTTKAEPWTHGRWQSFNRRIKHIETREVSG